MKRCDLIKGFVVLLTIMITFFCGVMPSSWAEDNVVPKCKYCADLKLTGCYGFSHSGMMIVPGFGEPIPMASVGVFYIDRKGNLTGHETVNFGGTPFYAEISGTFTVNPDCTGTATICAADPTNGHVPLESTISFVITSGGEEVQMVTTIMTPCGITPTGDFLPINIVGTAKKLKLKLNVE